MHFVKRMTVMSFQLNVKNLADYDKLDDHFSC